MLDQLKQDSESVSLAFTKSKKNNTFDQIRLDTLNPYFEKMVQSEKKFVDFVTSNMLNATEMPPLDQTFISVTEEALASSFTLWDKSIEIYKQQLMARKHILRVQQIYGLGLAALFSALAFLVGLFIMRQISLPLNNLTEATRRLASGDLSTRVEIFYQDEIGKVGIAFNNMAHAFQNIIGQLLELLEGIEKLAEGDFSARVTIRNPKEQVSQVADSFNKMASSFEAIMGQLQKFGNNLTTSALEIAAASKDQEAIIMQQETTTREISVTANRISHTARQFASTVSEVNRVAEDTSSLAEKGRESLITMEAVMRQMVDASGSIASKLAILNEKAGNITGMITTITRVADQTNLLSLNASIEAEKAGEFGRSFAVIAKEIRRLADQTALATLDIEKMINEIMSAVTSSVKGVDVFTQEIRGGVDQSGIVAEQLAQIIDRVQELSAQFETVNQGMQQQSEGAEQINSAISQLSQSAQHTTGSIHQFRRTIDQLNASATELRNAFAKIKK